MYRLWSLVFEFPLSWAYLQVLLTKWVRKWMNEWVSVAQVHFINKLLWSLHWFVVFIWILCYVCLWSLHFILLPFPPVKWPLAVDFWQTLKAKNSILTKVRSYRFPSYEPRLLSAHFNTRFSTSFSIVHKKKRAFLLWKVSSYLSYMSNVCSNCSNTHTQSCITLSHPTLLG